MKRIHQIFALLFFVSHIQAQRNVILIIADDLGTDYFGFYERYKDTVNVPNIRKLIQNGIRFSNATSNPVCSSTRAGVLTGRYSFRTGVGGIVGAGSSPLDTSEITLPRLLKIFNPKIATANIGKWHLHSPMPTSNLKFPNIMGYDHYEGSFTGAITSYTNWTKHTNGVASTITNYATSENVNNAVAWIKNQKNNPFFLWLAFNAPHDPIHLPPASLHTYSSLSGTMQDIRANPKNYYKAMLQALDTEIGRLVDSLNILGRLDSTDIIFIGDNGNATRTSQAKDTSRTKGTIYQAGVHIPFIISGPSVLNPSRQSDALINTADIFATVLELFGYSDWKSKIPNSKPVDSKSILPIIKSQNNEIRPWAFTEIFTSTKVEDEGKAIKNKDYKLLKFDKGAEELYKVSVDFYEENNLLLAINQEALENYNYLCGEMNKLIGPTIVCKIIDASYNPSEKNSYDIYPNPFLANINVHGKKYSDYFTLMDSMGNIIYSGKDIHSEDFSKLRSGIYFLKLIGENQRAVKLIKQ